jgi:4-amino-4-deoxy-L-arabinose transferase-like glycosyltransferase
MDLKNLSQRDKLLIFFILIFSVLTNFLNINNEGFGNSYYAAGVKSMLMSWNNFFYASFDPAGFVSLDKPPLGFWLQSLSAFVFGFNGWSLILPQAIAGVLSVLIILVIVSRTSGALAGYLSALFLAVTPICVVTNRNNTVDSLLVFTSLLASGAVLRASQRGSLKWLLFCMIFIGLGFNVKMMQAYLVLPACLVTYLLTASCSLRKRIMDLSVAITILFAISLSWIFVVDLTPPSKRPYVGGSTTNSALELAVNYNGITRWIGPLQSHQTMGENNPNQQFDGVFPDEIGQPGFLRLFSLPLAGQISWLLPISIFSLAFLATSRENNKLFYLHLSRTIVFWGTWLITCLIFFSFAVFFHRHYLVMLAPPIVALSGIGLSSLWKPSKAGRWKSCLLSLLVFINGLTTLAILSSYPTWHYWLSPIILTASIGVAIYFAINDLFSKQTTHMWRNAIFAIYIFCLLLPQVIWIGIPILGGGNKALPFAGPNVLVWHRYHNLEFDTSYLVNFLSDHYSGERFYVGTMSFEPAEWIILRTGKPVMAMGGYYGSDPILTVDKLSKYIASHDIRFFYFIDKFMFDLRPDLLAWFHQNCSPRFPNPANGDPFFQLYDCKK